MLADGSSKKVEHLLTTDVLMGDDGTPRHIQKLIRGHTGEDADKVRNVVPSLPPLKKEFMRDGGAGRPRTAEGKYYCKFQGCNFTTDKKNTIGGHETRHPEIPPPPMPGMYRISPSVGGLDSWTCNGSHVLVLRWNHRPSSVRFATNTEKTGTISRPWRFWAFEHRDNLVVMGFQCFESKEEAEQAQATATANFQPLEVEMSVDDFLSCASYVRESAVMFQPSGPLPFRSTGVSLQQHLQRTLGDEVSPELLAETAWVLGAYLTSGVGGEIAVPSGERAAVFKDRFRRWRDSTIMPYTGDESTPAGQESWCSFFGREPAGCQAEMQSSSSSAGQYFQYIFVHFTDSTSSLYSGLPFLHICIFARRERLER
jgi:hypothetical protein